MGRLLKALEKAGLVELSQENGASAEMQEEALREEPQAEEPAPQTDDPSPPPPALNDDGSIAEGAPFESFYGDVPSCAFPAEKMLKLLDGLKAMDLATRQSAVLAMDAADDSWTIDDAVADAKAKIKALTGQAAALTGQVTAIEKQTAQWVREMETQTDQAVGAIRKQIADLEALLARHVEKAGADKAAAQGRVQAAREACTRETGRLHGEASRLHGLIELFGGAKNG